MLAFQLQAIALNFTLIDIQSGHDHHPMARLNRLLILLPDRKLRRPEKPSMQPRRGVCAIDPISQWGCTGALLL